MSPSYPKRRRAKVSFADLETRMAEELAEQARGFRSEDALAETLVRVRHLYFNDRRAPKPIAVSLGLVSGYYVLHETDEACLFGVFRDTDEQRHFVYFHFMALEPGVECNPSPDILEHADDRIRRLGR